MIEDISTIKHFMNDHNLRDGMVKSVTIGIGQEEFNATVQFAYNTGYMCYVATVEWEFGDKVMQKLGLHGVYSTTFQSFEYENGELVISAEEGKIVIKAN